MTSSEYVKDYDFKLRVW